MKSPEHFSGYAGAPEAPETEVHPEQMIAKETERLGRFQNASRKVRAFAGALLLVTAFESGTTAVSAAKEAGQLKDEKKTEWVVKERNLTEEEPCQFLKQVGELPGSAELIVSNSDRDNNIEADIYAIKNKDGGADEGQSDTYAMVDRRYNDIILFKAISPEEAVKYGVHFASLTPHFKRQLERFKASEKKLMDHGWLALPDGRRGFLVPGSERVVEGKKVHTEVRRVHDDSGFEAVAAWEMDENGVEISYEAGGPTSFVYQKYIEFAKSRK